MLGFSKFFGRPPDLVAAIDLGSNSFHMIVARMKNGQLQIIDRLKEMVRLGAGLQDDKTLDEETRARALGCLERFGQRLRSMPEGSVRAVGTNTLRQVRAEEDFLLAAEPTRADIDAHMILIASALAQSAALAFGRSEAEAGDPHRSFDGDRPSTTILYRRLDPATLGALIALYEHKVVVQATIWGVNPFDQFGVELGKVLTGDLLPALETGDLEGFDASTAGLVRRIAELGESD